MISKLYFFSFSILSCTIAFLNICVFIAGETIILQVAASAIVLSISSAIPFAIFPIMFADAGAMSIISAFCARDT